MKVYYLVLPKLRGFRYNLLIARLKKLFETLSKCDNIKIKYYTKKDFYKIFKDTEIVFEIKPHMKKIAIELNGTIIVFECEKIEEIEIEKKIEKIELEREMEDYAKKLLNEGKVKYQISYDEDLDVYYVRVGLTPLEEYKIKRKFGEENFNKFIEILKDVILRKEKRKLPESEWWFE